MVSDELTKLTFSFVWRLCPKLDTNVSTGKHTHVSSSDGIMSMLVILEKTTTENCNLIKTNSAVTVSKRSMKTIIIGTARLTASTKEDMCSSQKFYFTGEKLWHIMCMDNGADAGRILLASTTAGWRGQLGRLRIAWLSAVRQDLRQHHLMLPEAADLAQNCPLWRMMSTYGTKQS